MSGTARTTGDRQTAETADVRARALAAESRRRMLGVLRGRSAPMFLVELADAVGLHVNTARFHLRALELAGLVERSVAPSGRRGRPRVAFRSVETDDGESRGERYLFLSRILADALSKPSGDAAARARRAGREWGRRAAAERPEPPSPGEPIRALAAMLDDLGFAPEVERDGRTPAMSLHRCPFLEAAREDPDVVCAVHLGLMRGALSAWNAPLQARALQPFVEPTRCRALFRRTSASSGRPR